MAWLPESDRHDRSAVNISGPVGDRLAVQLLGPVPGYDGCTWAGQVRKNRDGDVEAEFTFDDATTADVLDLTIIIEDTTSLVAGCL